MPRTVDHIVATHQHAAALRKQGKPIWSSSVNIRGIVQEDQDKELTPAIVADIANRVAKELRAKLPASTFDVTREDYDFGFNDAVEALEAMTEQSLADDVSEGYDVTDELDGWLEEVYDWADKNRVWLGA